MLDVSGFARHPQEHKLGVAHVEKGIVGAIKAEIPQRKLTLDC